MFDRARAECAAAAFGWRGYLLLAMSVHTMIAVDVAVVAAIPPFRSGVVAGAWPSAVALCCLVIVSALAMVVLLRGWVEAGEAGEPACD